MKTFKLSDMSRGWFIGNFEPTAFKTDSFEVNYRTHPAGESWDYHYHTETTEINLLVDGLMSFNDIELSPGDIFIVEPWQVSDPIFLKDTTVICVRVPSKNDKQVFTLSNQ